MPSELKAESSELLRSLSDTDRKELAEALGLSRLQRSVEESDRRIDSLSDLMKSAGYTSRVVALLGRVTHEAEMTSEEVLLKALGLFSRALDAERVGQKIAILDDDDTIVGEITGFREPLPSQTRLF